MMTKTTLAFATLALALLPSASQADDVEDFVKRLKGSVKSEVKSRLSNSSTTRGGSQDYRHSPSDRGHDHDRSLNDRRSYPDRGDSSSRYTSQPSRPSSSSSVKTRSLEYSSGTVPTSVRRAASQNKVGLSSSRSGGSRLSYSVDSHSKISRDDILFRKGSTEFADRYSYEIVRNLAYAMQDPSLRGMQFVIEGHASADGSYGKNLDLSQRRAERIVNEMIRLGVDPYSLIAVGYGESEAVYDSYSSERLLATDRKVVVYRMD